MTGTFKTMAAAGAVATTAALIPEQKTHQNKDESYPKIQEKRFNS